MQTKTNLFSDKNKVLKVYFFLSRVSYVLAALMALSFLVTMFDLFLLFTSISGLVLLGLQFYGSLHAERALGKSKLFGLYLAFGLNTLLLFSLFFPVSLFGYYALLNSEMRKRFPHESNPEWLNTCFKYLEDFEGKEVKA